MAFNYGSETERQDSFPHCRPVTVFHSTEKFTLRGGEYFSKLQGIRLNTISGQYYEVTLASQVEVGSSFMAVKSYMRAD
jgi:hypothetical protein